MSLNVNLLAFDVMLSLSISTVEHIIANKVIIIVRDIFGSFDNFFIAYDVIKYNRGVIDDIADNMRIRT